MPHLLTSSSSGVCASCVHPWKIQRPQRQGGPCSRIMIVHTHALELKKSGCIRPHRFLKHIAARTGLVVQWPRHVSAFAVYFCLFQSLSRTRGATRRSTCDVRHACHSASAEPPPCSGYQRCSPSANRERHSVKQNCTNCKIALSLHFVPPRNRHDREKTTSGERYTQSS